MSCAVNKHDISRIYCLCITHGCFVLARLVNAFLMWQQKLDKHAKKGAPTAAKCDRMSNFCGFLARFGGFGAKCDQLARFWCGHVFSEHVFACRNGVDANETAAPLRWTGCTNWAWNWCATLIFECIDQLNNYKMSPTLFKCFALPLNGCFWRNVITF